MKKSNVDEAHGGKVVAHPTLRASQLLQGMEWKNVERLVSLVEQMEEDASFLRALTEKLQGEVLDSSIGTLDLFAGFLGKYRIDHGNGSSERARPSTGEVGNAADRLAAEGLVAAAAQLEVRRKESRGFPRASFLADAVSNLYDGENDNPIEVIVEHLALFFDEADQRSAGLERPISLQSDLLQVLRLIANCFRETQTNRARLSVIRYWLSEPFSTPVKHDLVSAALPALAKLGTAYRDLLLDRLLSGVLGQENLDPQIECWEDWAWVFDQPSSRRHMRMVLSAAFELCDSSQAWNGKEQEIHVALSRFFHAVQAKQLEDGGRAFWDLEAATYHAAWLFYYPSLPFSRSVQVDFPSEFAFFAFEQADEAAYPGLPLWLGLISRAVAIGQVKLAQALGAYVLLEEIGWRKGVSDWESLLAIIRLLRVEPHFDLLAKAMHAATEVLRDQKHEILARRLEPFLATGTRAKQESIKYLIETVSRVSMEEAEHRLIENLSRENWEKFSLDAQTWLIEADFNWSDWRFANKGKGKPERTDWSPIALQFAKAIEHELVLRYEQVCKATGDVSIKVTLGAVAHFIKQAVLNEEGNDRSGVAPVLRCKLPQPDLARRLARFNQEYRNPSAHPQPFTLEKLDRMRRELFQERLLRDIAEQMM